MYKLYYSPGACSLAVHVALNEVGAEYSLENASITEGKNRSAEFLKINPRGQVPVLVDDDIVIREGGAILIYLMEKHNSPLLPRSGIERLKALEWLMFCNATLHPAYGRIFFLMKILGKDDPAREMLFEATISQINKLMTEIENHLENNFYLAGNNITIADILFTVISSWSVRMPKPVILGERTKALMEKILELPSYKKALEAEKK